MKQFICMICLILIFSSTLWAQEFSFKAPVAEVPENNFYKIILKPEILNRSQADLSDLRLYDLKNREVPFLIERTKPVQTRKHFLEYPIISKNIRNGVNTTLILRNLNRNKINNIGLLIKNTNVSKKAGLSGSNDAQNWFALEDNYVMQSVTNTLETSEVKVLQFPLSDYEFYRLEINDSASAPLNILAAGYYNFSEEEGNYTIINNFKFTQTDSSAVKKTFLKFSFDKPVLIDKLTFEIESPTFYRRNATVFSKQTVYNRGRRRNREELVAVHNFQLESDNKNAIPLNNFRSSEFIIVIDNADNPPLQIKNIQAFQLNTFLIAELKKDRKYELRFGNKDLIGPSYDLEYFRGKIPQTLPVLSTGTISELTAARQEERGLNRFFQTKVLIWIALLVVVVFLGFMTFQMLKETDKYDSSK